MADERKFLHELSNSIVAGYGQIKLMSNRLNKDMDSMTKEQILERLAIALTAFDKVNHLINERKGVIVNEKK